MFHICARSHVWTSVRVLCGGSRDRVVGGCLDRSAGADVLPHLAGDRGSRCCTTCFGDRLRRRPCGVATMIVVVVGLLLTGGIAAMVWRYWVASPDESDALGRLLLLGVFAAACAGAVWGFPFSGRVRACLVLGGCAVLAPYVLVVAAAVDARTTRARGLSTGLSTDAGPQRRTSGITQLVRSTVEAVALVMLYVVAAASVAVLVYVVVSQVFARVT